MSDTYNFNSLNPEMALHSNLLLYLEHMIDHIDHQDITTFPTSTLI